MGFKWLKIIGMVILFSLSVAILPKTVLAGKRSFDKGRNRIFAKEGFYIGFLIPHNSIGGDFNGDSILESESEIIIVPKIKSNFGWGLVLGGRFKRGSIELSYLRSNHDINWDDFEGKATYNLVNIDGKWHFFLDNPIQAHLLLGLCIPWLVTKDCSIDSTNNVGNAQFNGVGLNLGSGLAAYITPQTSINFGIVYRFIDYSKAKGVKGISRTIDDSLKGSGFNFIGGITVTF